jgi:signal peptidase I
LSAGDDHATVLRDVILSAEGIIVLGKRRSYAEAVQGRRKTLRRLGLLLIVFVCYELLFGLFLSTYATRSQAMAPTVLPGDKILATPLAFGPRTLFGKIPGFAHPERGDIVVADPNYARRVGFWTILSDSFVRFITFQLVSPAQSGPDGMLSAPTLLRVVGLPGDTIAMDDFIFKVKAAGNDQFLTEFELSTSRYDISHEDPPASWSADLPGSGHMAARTLGKDEYFLAGDARSSSSDSRLWGPVRIDRFRDKVLLRYWPPRRFGQL